MSAVTVLYTVLMYVAFAVLFGGLAVRILGYFRTPVPLKIFLAPAPLTKAGATWRVLREVLLFESLFKSVKWIWIFAALFHACLAFEFVAHLRYIIYPLPAPLALMQPFAFFGGLGLLAGIGGLWVRRLFIDRNAYISQVSDHLMLALLAAIALAGLGMRFVSHTDIVGVKAFMLGLILFDWQPLPEDFFLLVHLFLVALLMIVLPFSKLLHIPGVFFSPSRNQFDDARERRHLAPWNAAYDARRES